MDILKVFQDKITELGAREVAGLLELPEMVIKKFVNGKSIPSLPTCQRIIDLWGGEEGDGSVYNYEYDEEGILNASYCPPEWGRKKKAWDGRDVCLCLPILNDVPQPHHFSMMCLAMKYRMALRMEMRGDDSMIARSRNHLAKRFLDTGASWSLWIDSDMVFPIGNAGMYVTQTGMKGLPDKLMGASTIERLLSWNKTLVGGCYWDRRGGGKLIAGGRLTRPIPSDAIHPIDFNGTGMLMVHRQVYLDIAAKFPETLPQNGMGNESGFFLPIMQGGRMLGEDESFALRAAQAGHPTFLDLGLLCGHVGRGNIHGCPTKGSRI